MVCLLVFYADTLSYEGFYVMINTTSMTHCEHSAARAKMSMGSTVAKLKKTAGWINAPLYYIIRL